MSDIVINADAEVKVTIDKDMLKAYIEVGPPLGSGARCSLEKAKKALLDKQVAYGIIEENINQALMEENWGRKILVAEGKPSEKGKDAEISYKFPLPGDRIGPKMDEKGNVDYHDLNLIHNVKRGELLAERTPPGEGKKGINVMGQELPAPNGKDLRLPMGKNTVQDEQERALYAAIDGHVSLVNNKVFVDAVLQIKGNVDYSSGDIDFVGNVLISGGVIPGFKVKAQGDIEIAKSIEGAVVIAGGNILVKGGITTGPKGIVQAGENIHARFVENSRVEAGGDVQVREAIMQSNIKAGGSVRVSDRKAIIVGGHIQAFAEVESKVLGSPLATQTIVEVGINPHSREEYQRLVKNKIENKKIFDNLNHNLQLFQKSSVSLDKLSENKRATLLKMLEDYKKMRGEMAEAEERISALEKEFQQASFSRVKVMEIVYPGVRVSIGQSIYIVNDAFKYTAFVLDKGEVRLASLR